MKSLGLYADGNGYAGVIINFDSENENYIIINLFFARNPSFKDILFNLEKLKDIENCYINDIDSLKKCTNSYNSKSVDLNLTDKIFKAKSLFNDGDLKVVKELKDKVIETLNNFDIDNPDHISMALFLALECYEEYSYWGD